MTKTHTNMDSILSVSLFSITTMGGLDVYKASGTLLVCRRFTCLIYVFTSVAVGMPEIKYFK